MIDSPFVGFKFFDVAIFYKDDILNALRNTLVISGLGLLFSPVPAIFAIMLSEMRGSKFRKLVQIVSTLPNFVSWIIVFGLMWGVFSFDGAVNVLLQKLHWIKQPIDVFGNAEITWIFQSLLSVWKSMGFGAIIYLAAIAGIDSELYDAARVDGAGRFATIRHITIPGIMETYLVLLLLTIAGILNNGLDQYYVFHNALVAEKIEVLDYFVYRIGFGSDYSFSVVVGMLKSVISLVLLLVANLTAKKIRGSSMF